jgi:LysM repeat protein
MNYIVQPGDTLFLIATRFGTTVSALLGLNPEITNPDMIEPGMVLTISEIEPTPPTRICPLLRRGDRGRDVARLQILLRAAGFSPGFTDGIFGAQTQRMLTAFQRSVREIEIASGVADYETWTALGAQCDPGPVLPPGIVKYTVRPGESLYIISARFNVTVPEILKVNPDIQNPARILAGQEINVPVMQEGENG